MCDMRYLLKSDEHGNYVAIKGYTSSIIKICILHMRKQRLRSANAPLLSVLSGTQYSEVVCFGD